jgi:hypothetical protein
MTRKRGARAGYVSVAIDASRQPFTLTFLASFSTAVLILICNHFGLVDLAAVDPLAWESTISGALGSSALAISEIFGDLVSFHRKERLLASWQKNGFRSTRTAISRSTSWLSGGGAPFVAGGSPTAAGRSSNFAGGRSARPRLCLVAGKA